MNPKKTLEEQLEQLARAIPSGDSFVKGVMSRLETSSDSVQKPKPTFFRRIVMKNKFKFAAAAVVLFMVFTGWRVFDKSGSSGIVLAEVAQSVRQAKAFYYQIRTTMTGEPLTDSNKPMNMDGSVYVWFSADYGLKMEARVNDQLVNTAYFVQNQKKMVSVMPATKQYMEFDLNDDVLSKIKQQSHDPMQWLQKMVGAKYESIGRSILDGVEVEGFETTDPAIAGGITENVLARVWVDVKTRYPVQIEMDMEMNKGKTWMHIVINDFQWDLQADASFFTPDIPADYTAIPKMQNPKLDEQSLPPSQEQPLPESPSPSIAP